MKSSCFGDVGIVGNEFFFNTSGPFPDNKSVIFEDDFTLREYAWFGENSGGETHIVGMKKPNLYGIYDIINNVWERCDDVWHSEYVGPPSDSGPWVSDSERQPCCCLRKDAWNMDAFRIW